MKRMFCCMLLAFMLPLTCAFADTVTLAPYQPTADERAYAELLGLNTPHLIYTFDADSSVNLRLCVYALQENRWILANTQALTLPAQKGRLALFCERLDELLRIVIQGDGTTETTVCHPLFGVEQHGLICSTASLSKSVVFRKDQEIPLVLQTASEDTDMSGFLSPAALTAPAYAITAVFESKEDAP